MPTVTVPANAHAVVATGWTNPSNAYSTTGDNVYATALNGSTSKNISWSGDFGFANIGSGSIPDGATIVEVRIRCEANLSAAVTGGIFGVQGRVDGANSGTEATKTTTTEAEVVTTLGTVTLADLRAASTDIKARCRGAKGNSSSALTVNLDYVRLEVDYIVSNPVSVDAPTGWAVDWSMPPLAKVELEVQPAIASAADWAAPAAIDTGGIVVSLDALTGWAVDWATPTDITSLTAKFPDVGWAVAWTSSPIDAIEVNVYPGTAWAADWAVPPEVSVAEAPITGGTTAIVEVDASGAGTKQASGGSTALVVVLAEGEGREQSVGASTAVIEVTAEGAGHKAVSGGSTATVVVTPEGAGSKTRSGGSEATVEVDSEGAGRKSVSRGSVSVVEVLTEGGGYRIVSSGSTRVVAVEALGAGSKSVSEGSLAVVGVIASGHGLPSGGAGSFAIVEVDAEGGGFKRAEGGALAVVTTQGSGAGRKTALGGTTSIIGVDAEGGGFQVGQSVGGSTSIISVSSEGDGTKHASGGATGIVEVDATGAGSGGGSEGGTIAIVEIVPEGGGMKVATGGTTSVINTLAFGGGGSGTPVLEAPGKGLIDIHGLVVKALRDDPILAAIVDQRIFARRYPDRVDLPALRVDFPNATAIARPTIQWHRYDGQVAIHAETHIAAQSVAKEVQKALLRLQGNSFPQGWVAAVDPFGVWSGFDAEWTPPKPHWVVSVLITASGP